jgi:hypothetical protein
VPLEQLLDTEVVGAARFARQITDAASAVSVLTAQDIQALGLRTLGEVLDQMRGLHLTTDLDYVYLGARGIGGPGAYAGRVLMLVDGIAAVDNLFDQVFLGQDGLLDPALIERIEYAPGAGSAMYGNNAFLGVINIVTRRGRDLDGVEAAVAAGSNQDRQARLSAGRRLADNREWLASVTMRRNDSVPTSEVGHLPIPGQADALSYFFKGQWEDFDLQALGSRRSVQRHYPGTRPTTATPTVATCWPWATSMPGTTAGRRCCAPSGGPRSTTTLDWPGRATTRAASAPTDAGGAWRARPAMRAGPTTGWPWACACGPTRCCATGNRTTRACSRRTACGARASACRPRTNGAWRRTGG